MGYTPERQQPESFRARTIMPSLTVNDLDESVAWYTDVLGFTVKERSAPDAPRRGATLVAGDVVFMLWQDDFAQGRDRPKGIGLRFFLNTVQDIHQVADEILARGGTLAEEITRRPWGAKDFSVVDPDGFRITITEALDA